LRQFATEEIFNPLNEVRMYVEEEQLDQPTYIVIDLK
jgi:hypothetical protein